MFTNHSNRPAPIRPASDKARQVFGPERPATEQEPEGTFVTISIGRNVHSETGNNLSDQDWDGFRWSVYVLVDVLAFSVNGYSHSHGHGSEETYTVGGSIRDLPYAKAKLSRILTTYQQDAAAWVEGGDRVTAG